jgi:hypothetical protein
MGGQQLISSQAKKRASAEISRRAAAEELADAEKARADVANARIGHIYARTEAQLAFAETGAAKADAAAAAAREEAAQAHCATEDERKRSRVEKKEMVRSANAGQAALYRSEATASKVVMEAAAMERDEMQTEVLAVVKERNEAQREVATFSDPSMAALVRILAPEGGADALLKKSGGLDSLVTSEKAMDPSSRQHVDYKRAVALCTDGLFKVCSGGDPDRASMLMHAVGANLQKQTRREGTLWSESADAAALVRIQANIVTAWRGAKRGGDYRVARQILSLLSARPVDQEVVPLNGRTLPL